MTKDARRRLVELNDAAGLVHADDGVECGVEYRAHTRFADAQVSLCALAVGNVDECADEAGESPPRREACHLRFVNPAILAVEAPHPMLDLDCLVPTERFEVALTRLRQIIGMDVFRPVPAALDHVIERPPKERQKTAISEY